MEKILDAEKAKDFLGVSKAHLYRLTHEKKIKYFKPGGKKIYFRKCDLEEYLLGKLNAVDFGGLELAQELTGLAKETIISLCKQGLIPCWVRDGEYLFTRVELQLWVEAGRKKGLLK